MNTVAVIELKKYGRRQKTVKRSFVIFGESPHVELIKPKKLEKSVSQSKEGVLLTSIYSFRHAECAGIERVHIG